MIPRIIGRSYAIEACATVPDGGVEGVPVAFADYLHAHQTNVAVAQGIHG